MHEQNGDLEQLASQITFRDDPIHPGLTLEAIGPSPRSDEISASGTPVLILQGWFDNPGAAFKTYAALQNPRRVIVGPWNHNLQNASPFAAWHASGFELRGEILRFFDQYLKGIDNGYRRLKAVFYYTLGSETWEVADSWPPRTEVRRFYADGDGRLSDSQPAPSGAFDVYVADPAFRSVTGPGTILTDLSAAAPDRSTSDRKTLHYTSEPLTANVEVRGTPEVHLWVSSTANDGEFFACLEDVAPDGTVQYVTSGCLRGIHRRLTSGGDHSYRRADSMPLITGQPAELVIKVAPTYYQSSVGHRIRTVFYGGDTATFAKLLGTAPEWRVFRGGSRASMLVLPVDRSMLR